MTQLKIFTGRRLPRPVGVDWFRLLKSTKLLNLKPGDFVWFINKEDFIECAQVTKHSCRLDLLKKPEAHGIQVFCSSVHYSFGPHLIYDKQPGIFYMITDREAAYEYYEAPEAKTAEAKLKLVSSG